MPRRAILLSSLACLLAAPGAALAAGPVTSGAATPNASGVQLDPSVAIGPAGQRLVAATDLQGGSHVEVWQPTPNPTPAGQAGVTWDHATSVQSAIHPAIAWSGSGAARIVGESTTSCADAAGANVPLLSWTYDPSTNSLTTDPAMLTLNQGGRQTWPRNVLGSAGSTVAGAAITVSDEEACVDVPDPDPLKPPQVAAGTHQIIVTWDDAIPFRIAFGRMPAVAVLGTQALPGSPSVQATAIEVAYLSEPSGGQQDVMARRCYIANQPVSGFALPPICDAEEIIENNIAAPNGVQLGGHGSANAAPSIACATACHVAWTEAVSGGSRARVFLSDAAAPYTNWSSQPRTVAAVTASSQFLPSVNASVVATGERVDVVYLDTRGPAQYTAFQTSFQGSVRGLDTALTMGGYNPASGVPLGDRTAVDSFGSKGTVYGYFPGQISGDTPAVIETLVQHGTAPASIKVPAQDREIGKNTSSDITTWLGYDDPDGDPVTFTVADPPHGTITGTTYAPDTSWAGDDFVNVSVVEPGGTPLAASHKVTMTNQAPDFGPMVPAIVDEGGTVVVPLSATDPDVGDIVNFSIVQAPPPFNVGGKGKLTIVGSQLRIDVPAGVRLTSAVSVVLRATDTTTGEAPLIAQESVSVTIRANLATPVTVMSNGNVNVTGRRATITSQVGWSDIAAGCLDARSCAVRWTWAFDDGSTATITSAGRTGSITHDFPRAGIYQGTVSATILWGSMGPKTAPRTFNVIVRDDGRVVFKATPKVRRASRTRRIVDIIVRASAAAPVTVTLSARGLKGVKPQSHTFRAGGSWKFTFSISVKRLKTRRATIRVAPGPMTASGLAPTAFTRAIRL